MGNVGRCAGGGGVVSGGKYAQTTEVPVEKSRLEIERTLRKYGADAFAYAEEGRRVRLGFRMAGRQFRFELELPDPRSTRFTHSSRGARAPAVALAAWEQGCRSAWRALALVIKAKLEAVDAGISTLEDEFLANLILPNRETVGDWIRPQVEEAYKVGTMPAALMLEGPR